MNKTLRLVVLLLALLVVGCGDDPAAQPEPDPEETQVGEDTGAPEVEEPEEPASPDADTHAPGELQRVEFRLDWIRTGYQAPFYLALEEGYWRDEGLEVIIREGSGSGDAIRSVIGRRDSVGLADRAAMALARSDGAPVVSVMGVVNRGALVFSSSEELGITEPSDLVGRTVLTTLGGSDGALLPAFLELNGIDLRDVTVRGVEPASKLSLLRDGEGDAATNIYYSQPPILEAQGMSLNNMLWSDFDFNILGNGIVVREDFAEENPELISGFVAGLARALEDALADPQRAADAYLNQFPQEDPDIVLAQVQGSVELLHSDRTVDQPIGYQDLDDWEETISRLVEAGEISEALETTAYFTNDYLP